jgi:hypothetical protein
MTTQEFLSALEAHPQQALVFDYGAGQVKPGYHVTEVMNVTYESMDCGGQANFWRETIVQLQGPGSKDKPEFMSTDKFLSIYNRVVKSVPVRPDSEVRLEYGDTERPAIHYHVRSIQTQDGRVVVQLSPPGVTCKAADRVNAACGCGPESKPIELDMVVAGSSKCC